MSISLSTLELVVNSNIGSNDRGWSLRFDSRGRQISLALVRKQQTTSSETRGQNNSKLPSIVTKTNEVSVKGELNRIVLSTSHETRQT